MPAPSPRRLLLVSHRPIETGGTTRWRHLAHALPELGWTVHAVTARPAVGGDPTSTDPGVARVSAARARVMGAAGAAMRPVVRRTLGVQPEAFAPSIAWSFTGRRAIRRAIARHRPHVVVATSPPPAALFAAAATARDLPLVADLRDPWAGSPYYDAGGTLLRRIERSALSRANAIVAVTAPMLDELRLRHPALAGRMRLLPNGYAPALLEGRPTAAPDWRTRRITLIHPGTLYGGRNVSALVTAMREPDLRERVRLQVLGNVDPASEESIQRARSEIDVELLPPVEWEAAIERVRAADAVVVIQPPELGDSIAWPVKTFEALALGKPVLAVTGGGAVEVLLNDLGQPAGCARHESPPSIAAALRRLLAAPPAPVPVVRLAPWDRSAIAADYAALLDELVAGRNGAA